MDERYERNNLLINLQPGNVDLNVEVANAAHECHRLFGYHYHPKTHFDTMASSGMTWKCFAVIMSLFPVVVTKTLPRGAASSIVVTS